MTDQIARIRLMLILVLAGCSSVIWLLLIPTATATQPYLQVHFLDVGQGDAILIETPDGVQVLIDGGRDAGVLRELSRQLPIADRSIDLVVATHEDSDHIGGLIDVLKRYQVASILLTENQSDTDAADSFRNGVASEGAEVLHARRGQEIKLGASTTLSVLFPERDPTDLETNASSIILQLQYGEIEFLLTGDAPKGIEEYLVLIEGEALQSEVLKVGHHGSRTSTSELFLAEVKPDFAVISASADNPYGHPHVEVTDALFNNRVTTLTTAEAGTISFYSDGTEVWVE